MDWGIDRVGFGLESEALEAVGLRLEAKSGSRALRRIARVEPTRGLVEKTERVGSDPRHGGDWCFFPLTSDCSVEEGGR